MALHHRRLGSPLRPDTRLTLGRVVKFKGGDRKSDGSKWLLISLRANQVLFSRFWKNTFGEKTKQKQNKIKNTQLLFCEMAETFYTAFFFFPRNWREFLAARQAQEMKWILTAGREQKSLPPVPCKMRVSLRTSYASAFSPLQLKCILHYVFSF